MSKRLKVLLVRFSSLGDVVLATAAVEALREQRPDMQVDVLTKPAFREIFRNNPGVGQVLRWDPQDGLGALAESVRQGGYDWILDLHANLRTRLLRLRVRGVRWSVYRKGAARRRLSVALRRAGLLPDNLHVVDRYVEALRPLGLVAQRTLPRLYPGDDERVEADRKMRAAGWDGRQPCVALAPGARWATKAWPVGHWRELPAALRERGDLFVVVIGGRDDADLAEEVLGGGEGANLAGKTSLLQTAAVLEKTSCLVTNDSAPLHVAAAVGTPSVALFGPTVSGFGFFPVGSRDRLLERDLGCRPCSLHGDPLCPLGHHNCLGELSPEAVLGAVGELLAETQASRVQEEVAHKC